jgi:hypothetical protein
MVPLITTHTPAGTSTYTIIHYMQEYSTGMFNLYILSHKFVISEMSKMIMIMMVVVENCIMNSTL